MVSKQIILLLTVFSLIMLSMGQDQAKQSQFEEYKQKFNKKYTIEEEAYRFRVFLDNLDIIDKLNKEQSSAKFDINHFADLSPSEFAQKYLLEKKKVEKFSPEKYSATPDVSNIPESFDWRQHGAVTGVKDQGSVGTCWVFSTTGNIEGQHFLKNKELVPLSEQQVVDCDSTISKTDDHKADCGVFGGWPFLAMQYIMNIGGIAKEQDYPYCVGIPGDKACYPCSAPGYNTKRCGPGLHPPSCNANYTCKDKTIEKYVQIDDWKALSSNETELAAQLIQTGPLSVALDASSLQHYSSGVFDPFFGCSKTDLDHAVLMVGYGVEPAGIFSSEKPYWWIKNSWGSSWGINGFFKIKRGSGTCGINTQAVTAIIKDKKTTFKQQQFLMN